MAHEPPISKVVYKAEWDEPRIRVRLKRKYFRWWQFRKSRAGKKWLKTVEETFEPGQKIIVHAIEKKFSDSLLYGFSMEFSPEEVEQLAEKVKEEIDANKAKGNG